VSGRTSGIEEFGRLVGTWKMGGDIDGTVTYRWALGKRFLIQDVDLVYAGRRIAGVEMIGHLAKVGATPTPEVWSRFYSFYDGLTLDYLYEFEGDVFRVWFEDKSLNNFLQATLAPGGLSFEGAWSWPGGGYSFTATRVE